MKIDRARPFLFYIDLPVRNEWRNIELLRTSVQNCYQAVFSDIDGCNALAMVTGELLENAMKYGAWSRNEDPISFRLRVQGDSEQTRVEVQNPIRDDDPQVNELKHTLAWIAGHESAEAAYRARLIEIANAPDDPGASKLGLVRVAYEGGCELRATVEDSVLTLVAVLKND